MRATIKSPLSGGRDNSDQPALRVEGAGKKFRGGGWVLRDCSFTVRRGSITALVGPNGSGKTTVMAAAVGLIDLNEGDIAIHGTAVRGTTVRPELGYLAQDKPLYRQYTVSTLLDIGGHLNSRWDSALADRLCEEADLDLRAKVGTLSGGQRTRLALALVLARRPSLLLLDEPLADLDPLARLEVQQTLLAEVADTGVTVLMSSHILGEIQDTSDDLLLLANGRIVLHGPIDDAVDRHILLTGPGEDEAGLALLPSSQVVETRRSPRQLRVLVDGQPPYVPDGWTAATPTLEEVVVARFRSARTDNDLTR